MRARGRRQPQILLAVDRSVRPEALRQAGTVARALEGHLDLWIIVETLDEVRAVLPQLQYHLGILEESTSDLDGQVKKGLAADIMRDLGEREYDLVILAFRGRRGLKKIFPRPEALSILHHAKVHYLILWGRGRTIRRVLFCTGGSPYGQQAAEFGAQIAAPLGASATLLYVAETEPTLFVRQPQEPREPREAREPLEIADAQVKGRVEETRQMLQEAGLEVEVKVRHGKVAREILAEAISGRYDLIVLGSHGMGGIRSYILGSVSEEVVKGARIPILVVRAQEKRKLWRRLLGLQ